MRRSAAAAAALVTALAWSRSLRGGFLSLDDEAHLLFNAAWREPGALRWMLGLNWVHWYPLTWLSFALDHALWGLKPFGCHLTNVALHALNAALVCLLFTRLLERGGLKDERRRALGAAFGALLFSLHPFRAESVSWLTERSDLLSASFILATALAWLDGRTGLALALHGLGLTAKAVGMPVPLALAALDFLGFGRPWKDAKSEARDLAPFLALSFADGLLNVAAQRHAGSLVALSSVSPLGRLSVAAWSLWHGVAGTLGLHAPNALIAMPKPFVPSEPRYLLAGAGVLGASAAAWAFRKRAPGPAAAWACYVLMSLPLCGLLKGGPQLAADRYAYVAALGLPALAAAAFARSRARLAPYVALWLLLALGSRAWERQADWLDSTALWSSVLREEPGNVVALHFSAVERLKAGDAAGAESLLRRATRLDPEHAPTRGTLAILLSRAGRDGEALEQYDAAIRLDPSRPEPRYNRALSLEKLGRREEALAAAEELFAREPGNGRAAALVERLRPGPRRKKL